MGAIVAEMNIAVNTMKALKRKAYNEFREKFAGSFTYFFLVSIK